MTLKSFNDELNFDPTSNCIPRKGACW